MFSRNPLSSDAYNPYIWGLADGRLNTVTTIIFSSTEAATQPWVLAAINTSDALFFAGGDQVRRRHHNPNRGPWPLRAAAAVLSKRKFRTDARHAAPKRATHLHVHHVHSSHPGPRRPITLNTSSATSRTRLTRARAAPAWAAPALGPITSPTLCSRRRTTPLR